MEERRREKTKKMGEIGKRKGGSEGEREEEWRMLKRGRREDF